MAAVRPVLGSGRTIVVGLGLVALGAVLFSLGKTAEYGWFAYGPLNGEIAVPPARLGTQQLVGLTVVGVGLLLSACAAGFRMGVRAGARTDDTN